MLSRAHFKPFLAFAHEYSLFSWSWFLNISMINNPQEKQLAFINEN